MTADLFTLYERPVEEVFSIERADAERLQLAALRQRFEELRDRIAIVASLADDLEITEIASLEDIVPLCLPHTMYKSYSASFIERGRYDRLTEWFAALTTEDLSAIDTTGCDSLEGWLDTLEAGSSLRPLVSGGTTGKVSFFPRSLIEQDQFIRFMLQALSGYRDEPDSGLLRGEMDWFAAVPMATGRQNFPRIFGLIRDYCFGGDQSRVHILGRGHWSADMLWLSGRLRAAQARGETASIELAPAFEQVRERIAAEQADVEGRVDAFIDELVAHGRRQPLILFAPLGQLIDMAARCRERGLHAAFRPESFIVTGRAYKGQPFPDGWEVLMDEFLPPPYQELYGMTESTGQCRLCSEGWFHWPPAVVTFLVDPDTGVPLPRTGLQTGRFVLFDLSPRTHWGGAITGDRATIDWDAECPCGRKGPRLRNDVTRFIQLRDDDKITCAQSPDAYERAAADLLQI